MAEMSTPQSMARIALGFLCGTKDNSSRRGIMTEVPEEDLLPKLIECLVTAETVASQLPQPANILALVRATLEAIVSKFPEAADLLGQSQTKSEDSNFFIAPHRSGVYLPDTLQSLAKLPTFQGQGYAPHITFNPNTVEADLQLFNLEDDTQLSYETQTDILSQGQGEGKGEGEVLAFAKSIEIEERFKFQWPSFSYHDRRPTIEEAHEAIEALIAQAHRNITATSFSSGASVRLNNPILQHPGERLEELSQRPEFPDYTQVYFHIAGKNGVTPFHTEDNGLRSFNLCHIGYKAWIIIPDSSRNSFEEYILRKIGLSINQVCDQFIMHLGILCSPSQLSKADIDYRIIVQGPGEYVTLTSSEYHMVIGLTSSIVTSHDFLYPDDPDIITVLEDAKICEECGNYPLIRDYNVNHTTKIGSQATPTVEALLQELAQSKSECNANRNQRHREQNNISGDNATTKTNNDDRKKRPALPTETNSAKRKKPLSQIAPAAASKTTEQSHTTVTASSSFQALPQSELRRRTREPVQPAQRMSRGAAVASPAPAPTLAPALAPAPTSTPTPTPTSVSADSSEESAICKRESQSPSLGTDHDSVSVNEDTATTLKTSLSSLPPSTRHNTLPEFDIFFRSNPICREELIALPAHNRCGLAAALYTKQRLEDFLAAVKDQNNRSEGDGKCDLEKALLSSGSGSEDPATYAMRNAILEIARGNRYSIGLQKTNYRQRFFCYRARRLWEDARVKTSPWGLYKAMGAGQVRLDPAARDSLTQQLLSTDYTKTATAEVHAYINVVLSQGIKWDSLVSGIGIGMGIIALVPYRRKELHTLNVSAKYYYEGLYGESSLPRLQEFQSALDTPYMKALLTAANALADAIVHNKKVSFEFQNYHGKEPISSLPEAEICRLLRTVPTVDPGAATD